LSDFVSSYERRMRRRWRGVLLGRLQLSSVVWYEALAAYTLESLLPHD
jgi:hypothetical protein